MPRPARLLLALGIASSAILPGSLAAQAEFAVPVRPGQLRIDIDPYWLSYDHYFDPGSPGTLVPVAAPFQADSFGVAQLPFLSGPQSQIQQVSGVGTFTFDLGATQVAMTKSVRTIPIGFELGLSRRLAIGATVPLVQSRVDVSFLVDSTRPGNVGLNPGLNNPSAVAPFQSQIAAALSALQAQADSGPAALRSQAQALLATLQPFLGLSAAPLLPLPSTAAATGITTRLDSAQAAYAQLAGQYSAAGVTLPVFTDALLLPDSGATLGRAGLEQFFSDPGLPVAADTFGTMLHTGIGDVSAHLTYQLRDADAFRSQILVTARFPTGSPPSATSFVDLGTGTHEFGLDAALASDVRLGDRFLLHTVVRGGGAAADQLPMRVTPPGLPFAPFSQVATIKRTPAPYVGLELDPVWLMDDAFSVRVLYQFFSQGTTRHSYVNPADSAQVGLPASVLDEGTAMRWMGIGVGVTFSTLDRFTRGLAAVPYNLTVSYENTIWGREGWVPQQGIFRITLRAYANLFGKTAASPSH